jgi:hypothetical protein
VAHNALVRKSPEHCTHTTTTSLFIIEILTKKHKLWLTAKGYYSGGAQKFGEKGDFITAPETSDLFGFCLARQCAQVLESGDSILEFGAGSFKAISLINQSFRRHGIQHLIGNHHT